MTPPHSRSVVPPFYSRAARLLRKDSGRVDAPGRRLARVAIRPFESSIGFAPIQLLCHAQYSSDAPYTAPRALDWLRPIAVSRHRDV
jgi:hypothetical protein